MHGRTGIKKKKKIMRLYVDEAIDIFFTLKGSDSKIKLQKSSVKGQKTTVFLNTCRINAK